MFGYVKPHLYLKYAYFIELNPYLIIKNLIKDLKHSSLASNIYLARQCAAVSTHWSLSRLPPQKWNPWLVWRDTCHGQRLRAASVPPTIIVPGMGPFSPSKPPMCSGTVKMNHTNSVLCSWEFNRNSFLRIKY